MLEQLLSQLLPAIAGAIAMVTFQYVKHGITLLDQAPAWLKQLLVVLLASGLTWLGTVLGVSVPPDPHAINPTVWQAIIAGALALAAHAVVKGSSSTTGA